MAILRMTSSLNPATGEVLVAPAQFNFDLDKMDLTTLKATDNGLHATFDYQTANGTAKQWIESTVALINAGIVTASGSAGYALVASS